MPKFVVELSCTKTEYWLVEASDRESADENLFDGYLFDTTEESDTVTAVRPATEKEVREHGKFVHVANQP